MPFLSNLGSSFNEVFLYLLALLMAMFVAIPFHEFAHAFVAKKEGDYTATACRRCTLGALSHFDISGFLMLMLFGFGWAKPVPVDSRNFKRGRKSQFLVSIAGIVTNIILGVLFLFIYVLIFKIDGGKFFNSSWFGYLLYSFLVCSVNLNFGLAIFNLLPIYPLDGYNIIDSFCRTNNGFLYFAKRYSFIIFIILLVTNLYNLYYSVVIKAIFDGLLKLFTWMLGM